ncbi:hypothetical protein EXS65_02650 [Candidatus Peribacteria bacterium]|nr:hypothetical protein [Candidatus Peribacteria bacterium]
MITFSAKTGGACSVTTSTVTFDVFPSKVEKDTWTFLGHPEEERGNKKIVSWPGEYDFAGISVRGVGQEAGRQVSYVCHTESVRTAFIDSPILDWSDSDIEKIGEVDVLVIAADAPKKVLALVEAVDPRVIILFQVKDGDLAGTAKICGMASVQKVSEFKAKAGSLPQDSRQVVVLG